MVSQPGQSHNNHVELNEKRERKEHREHDHAHCCDSMKQLPQLDTHLTIPNTTSTQVVYRIRNMDCPTEEALIRKKLANFPEITQLDFDLIQRILTVHHQQASLSDVEAALVAIDMLPEAIIQNDNQNINGFASDINWLRLGLAGGMALAAEVAHFANAPDWMTLILALVAIIIGGFETYKKGWIALKNFNLNMNALMSFAVTGALLIGQWPEAAMVMVLFALAEAIEQKSMDRASNAIQQLLNITPENATVLQADERWLAVDIKSVPVGSIVRVKPGERIALDGVIISGQSTINQAAITGESLPVDKAIGESVYAGTINESGSFEFKVTAIAAQSTIARIIKAVESAQRSKANTQRFVDIFARIYTPVVFVIALAIAIIPPLIMGALWFDWIYKALVLLVIACPCALVISTPVTIVSGLAAATRYGILIKGGMFLEQGRKISILAVDKTGTLTNGKPVQTDFVKIGTLTEQTCREIAASLANHSDHPVSKAITYAAEQDGIDLYNVTHFMAVLGQGIKAIIDDQQWYLGNHRMVIEHGLDKPELAQQIQYFEQQAKTVVLLMNDNTVQALFAVADTIKQSSSKAIKLIKQMGIKTLMLTGDNTLTANIIANEIGIDEVKSHLLPEDKLTIVNELLSMGVVGMVGDGINDAPALAKANIGFAMGSIGSDTAIETADVALMDDDLCKIPQFIQLSKATSRILIENIVFALVVKMLFFILTFMGLANMWMAVFADIGTSLLVVANGLRLLKKRFDLSN